MTVSTTSRLDELVVQIGNEHQSVSATMTAALSHAIRAGELLIEAKEIVPFGQWDKWLAERCATEWNLSLEWARSYMRIARNRELIEDNQIESLAAARRFLTVSGVGDSRVDPVKRTEAVVLRQQGLKQQEIADKLGVSQGTITRWLDPAKEKKYKETYRRTWIAARQALKRETAKRQAREIGGDLGEAYSLLRRCLDSLERAAADHDSDTRREIRSAMHSMYNAEDALNRALAHSRSSKRVAS